MSSLTQLQLGVKRRNVAEFVRRNSSPVELFRTERIDDGEGGKIDGDTVSLGVQYFRVIDPQVKRSPPEHLDPMAGEIFNYDLALVGLWNARIEEGDTFTYGDEGFRVDHVSLEAGDRTVAGASYQSGL